MVNVLTPNFRRCRRVGILCLRAHVSLRRYADHNGQQAGLLQSAGPDLLYESILCGAHMGFDAHVIFSNNDIDISPLQRIKNSTSCALNTGSSSTRMCVLDAWDDYHGCKLIQAYISDGTHNARGPATQAQDRGASEPL
jgi:hypothetical protein